MRIEGLTVVEFLINNMAKQSTTVTSLPNSFFVAFDTTKPTLIFTSSSNDIVRKMDQWASDVHSITKRHDHDMFIIYELSNLNDEAVRLSLDVFVKSCLDPSLLSIYMEIIQFLCEDDSHIRREILNGDNVLLGEPIPQSLYEMLINP